MTDIPNTHTFKPDYLCDPPCSYHDALQEALQTIKDQADEIERLKAENDGEMAARINIELALRKKEAAMDMLFDRLRDAGVDYSDLIL